MINSEKTLPTIGWRDEGRGRVLEPKNQGHQVKLGLWRR